MKHHRHPWAAEEESFLRVAKAVQPKMPHKVIARRLGRTPRSVDQQVARMKEQGRLATHRREEQDLLAKLIAESRQPEWYPHQ